MYNSKKMKFKRFLGYNLCILVLINLRFCVTLKFIHTSKVNWWESKERNRRNWVYQRLGLQIDLDQNNFTDELLCSLTK